MTDWHGLDREHLYSKLVGMAFDLCAEGVISEDEQENYCDRWQGMDENQLERELERFRARYPRQSRR